MSLEGKSSMERCAEALAIAGRIELLCKALSQELYEGGLEKACQLLGFDRQGSEMAKCCEADGKAVSAEFRLEAVISDLRDAALEKMEELGK